MKYNNELGAYWPMWHLKTAKYITLWGIIMQQEVISHKTPCCTTWRQNYMKIFRRSP